MNGIQERRQGEERVQRLLFYGALLLVILGVWQVTRPFLTSLGWAAIFAICFWPLHARLLKRFSPPAAAAISTVALTMLLVVPAILLLIALGRQAAGAIGAVQQAFDAGIPTPITTVYEKLAAILPLPPMEDLIAQAKELLASTSGLIAKQAGVVVGAVLMVLFDILVMVLALYFCFRDGPALSAAVRRLLPFDDRHNARMMLSTHDMIHASVTSGVIVAAVQGLLGGLLFAILGIEAAMFWGVVMGFLSLFPLIGSWLVWAPAALWLLSTGHVGKGLTLAVLGVVLVGGVDNVLRPILIGGRTSMGILLLFIGLLGGVAAFGFIGLVLGPVVLAVALSLYHTYTRPEPEPTDPFASAVGTVTDASAAS